MQKLTEAELKLMTIIWKNNKIISRTLVSVCNKELGWKKSTMYTVLKKLEEKGMVINQNTVVSYIVSPEEYNDFQKRTVIEQYFSGSLPQFITAFAREKKLSKKDIQALEKIIDNYKEDLLDD